MLSEVKFAGFGGQGIMMIGKLLAYAGMEEGMEVAWIPSYGPEMRGGTAYCDVVLSDRPIGSPIVTNPRHLIVMNLPSLEKFEDRVKLDGLIIINSSLIPVDSKRTDIPTYKVNCNEIAIELGNGRAANMVALGAYIGATGLITRRVIESAIRDQFKRKPKIAELNIKAFQRGAEITAKAKGAR